MIKIMESGLKLATKKICMNCYWHRWSGPHLGCFFGGRFVAWLRQKDAEKFAICEDLNKCLKEVWKCKWEPEKTQRYTKEVATSQQVIELLDSTEVLLELTKETKLTPETVTLVLEALKDIVREKL